MNGRRFIALTLSLAAAPLLLLAAFLAWSDPYHVWRAAPPWHYSPALDQKMRFVKSVQFPARAPEIIFLGSSTVYRGIDPADLAPGARYYNFGISSLRMVEALGYLRYSLQWTRLHRVVLGLDFFMFDANVESESGFDPRLPAAGSGVEFLLTTVLSLTAAVDAYAALTIEPAANHDGEWLANGFKTSSPRSRDVVELNLENARHEFEHFDLGERGFSALGDIIALCRAKHVELELYFSPAHRRYLEMIRDVGVGEKYEAWRRRIVDIARREQVPLWDFASDQRLTDSPLAGSSPFFIDANHFSPMIGRAIMRRLNLPVRTEYLAADDRALADFGRPLVP
jgi:hypothetical protein